MLVLRVLVLRLLKFQLGHNTSTASGEKSAKVSWDKTFNMNQ